MSAAAQRLEGGWHASLRLGFRRGPGRTILAERFRQGPLAVQRALYPEGGPCHVYLLHPPGGVAGGDTLDISARVAPGAEALVTTPGATKFYHSVGPVARQRQRLDIDGGTLEWLPQENILFPGADAHLTTEVELKGDAKFIGWEIHCLGLPVVGERFESGRAVFGFSLLRDGLPLLHERLVVGNDRDLSAPAGLRGHPVVATLYATTVDNGVLEAAREAVPMEHRRQLGITLVDGVLVARYLGGSTERARGLFVCLWETIRPAVLGRTACAPRIWNT